MTQVLAIDQGTTNTKAVLVGPDGTVQASGSAPVAVSHRQPGWVEQDPDHDHVAVHDLRVEQDRGRHVGERAEEGDEERVVGRGQLALRDDEVRSR